MCKPRVTLLAAALFVLSLGGIAFGIDAQNKAAVNSSADVKNVVGYGSANSYIYTVYTTSTDGGYAFRYFNAGQDIYFTTEYRNAIQGNVQLLHIITTPIGQVEEATTVNVSDVPVGSRTSFNIKSLPAGSYTYTSIVITQDAALLSPVGYDFEVL